PESYVRRDFCGEPDVDSPENGYSARSSMRTPAIVLITVSAVLGGCASVSRPDGFQSAAGPDVGQHSDRLVQLATEFEAHGDTTAAIALYRQASAVPGGGAIAANIRLGDAYARIENHKGAIEAYRAALAKDPNSSEALLGLGTALIRTNNIDG